MNFKNTIMSIFSIISSSLPYIEPKTESGNILKLPGSSKNYIKPSLAKKRLPNEKPFRAKSIVKDVKITEHTYINLFNIKEKIKFYLMLLLESFDANLGNDTLRALGAVIYTAENKILVLKNGRMVRLKQQASHSVNAINIKEEGLSPKQKNIMKDIVNTYPNLFSEPDERLTYTTKVMGQIRTQTDSPVYSKFYPYPAMMKSGIESQVKKLLNGGIIRPSRSPYNSPIWVVPKKSEGDKQYRMVIDYRKFDSATMADRYPIPEISEVISNLGESSSLAELRTNTSIILRKLCNPRRGQHKNIQFGQM